MKTIIYSFFLFCNLLLTAEMTATQEKTSKPVAAIKVIYIINATGKKIRAIFKPVATIIQLGEVGQVRSGSEEPTNEQSLDELIAQSTPYPMEFGLCLKASQKAQKIILEQKKLSAKDFFEGILDWSTATTCTLILYDNKEERIIKKDFMITDNVTYKIKYKNKQLIVKNINQ